MKEYYSRPVAIKAILLTKDNVDEVAKLCTINGTPAQTINLDSKGRVADPGIITAFRGITIKQFDGPENWMVAAPGEWILIEQGGAFAISDTQFKTYYTESMGDVSDGFHSFNELYDHRIELFIQLCKKIDEKQHGRVFRTRVHSNGAVWPGWFMLGIDREAGKQISYHLPDSRWDEVDFAFDEEIAPEWDGHTPADVLIRLKQI